MGLGTPEEWIGSCRVSSRRANRTAVSADLNQGARRPSIARDQYPLSISLISRRDPDASSDNHEQLLDGAVPWLIVSRQRSKLRLVRRIIRGPIVVPEVYDNAGNTTNNKSNDEHHNRGHFSPEIRCRCQGGTERSGPPVHTTSPGGALSLGANPAGRGSPSVGYVDTSRPEPLLRLY